MLTTLFIAFLSLNQAVEPRFQEKIEARVGEDIITSTDLALMLDTLRSEHPTEAESSLRQKALDTLIDQSLMTHYLADQGISISDREIEQRINSIRTSNGIQNNDQFRALLEKQGMSFDKFKMQLRHQFEQAQFFQAMRRQIEPKLPKSGDKLGDQELLAYFKNNPQLFNKNFEVQLQECVLSFDKDPSKTEKLANEYQSHPKNFDKCVKNSQSPSKAQNGIIGTFQKGQLRDDVEARVYALKKGEVAMVRMPGGIQLLKVTKLKDLGPVKFVDTKEKIREELASTLVQKEVQNTLADLKSKIYIKI